MALLYFDTRGRLREEIRNLTKRGNLNLTSGVLLTLIAIGVLVYLVTRPHGDFNKTADVLAFYIPRVTTIALLETFAYFFLRLYRSSLEEIKYYQNELTTLASVEIAWRTSLWEDIGETTAAVVVQLAKNDRNANSALSVREETRIPSDVADIIKLVIKLSGESSKSKE